MLKQVCEKALAASDILFHKCAESLMSVSCCRYILLSDQQKQGSVTHIYSQVEIFSRHTNTPTDEDCKDFLFMLALPKKIDATATSTGTLRKHLRSWSHLNDHSSQWENCNGGPGRKEGSCQLANFRHSTSQMKC